MTQYEDSDAHGVIAVTLQSVTDVGWMTSQRVANDILAQLNEAGYTVARQTRNTRTVNGFDLKAGVHEIRDNDG